MAPGGAEHVVQDRARAVDDRGQLDESRGRRDEAEHGEHARDPVEVAELGPEHGQRVQRAPACGLGARLDGDVGAEHAGVDERAGVVAGELARRAGPVPVHHDRVERLVGRIRAREHEPELLEAVLDR